MCQNVLHIYFPGQEVRASSGRRTPEKIGTISDRNTASNSRDFRRFPTGSDDFPASFLQDPAVGIVDLGCYKFNFMECMY